MQKYKKEYVKEVVPRLLEFIKKSSLFSAGIIKKVESI
jgi:hypothetical protein